MDSNSENKDKILQNTQINNKNYQSKDQNILKLCEKEIKNINERKENKNNENKAKINSKQNESQNKQEIQNEKIEFTKKIGNYILYDQIGMGTFSKVTKALHLITSQQVAVKILDKEKIEDEIDLERVIREIEILKNIHHPNIAQMYETYSTIHNFYLMMELVTGGDLFDYISNNTFLSENLSCHFFRQLIGVLEYLISMGITHRDIKPENILLDENRKNIKVIDFGLSNYCEDNELLSSSCGSPCYASPEMLSGNAYHGDKTDIWSAGVALYSMLVGSLPFDDQELYNLYEQIKKGKFYLPSTLSLEAIDLLKRILQVDPKKRIGIKEIKKHPWFNMEKNPIYRGINISKEKFPCNKDVVKFIYENYFSDEKEIDIDTIIKMIETHACNKYTSTYYLTKTNILGIDDELLILNDENKNEKIEDIDLIQIKNSNNNVEIMQPKKEINLNENNILTYKKRKIHKSFTKDILNKNYINLKNNILGLLDENDIYNNIIHINKDFNKKENYYIDNKETKNENNGIILINNDSKHAIDRGVLNNLKIEDSNKVKANIINKSNIKKEKIINKRNNKKILYISTIDRNKLYPINMQKEPNNLSTQYKNILYYNTIYNKDSMNLNCSKEKNKLKTNNNSYNKNNTNNNININNNIIIKNNKKIHIKNKNKTLFNLSKNNNNLAEGYDKKQVAYIKENKTASKINEIKKNLIQLKTPPKEKNNFNFYVINNIINKDKYFDQKKFDTLNYDNKTIMREITEPNEIKAFVNKKIYNLNIIKNKNKDNEFNILRKILTKQKNSESRNNKHHLKIKTNQPLVPFQLNTQLKNGKKIKIKEELNKLNKIKVNLKSNNSDLNYNKSPSKTLEINSYKKDLKKIIPKLKLEGINNKIKNINPKKIMKECNTVYNKISIKNNYSYYTHRTVNNKDNIIGTQNSINSRSDSLSNTNKTRIYKKKSNKKNCIISKNNKNHLKTINSLNKGIKILNHQRNLSSSLKSKISNLKTENNLMINSNKISFIIKDNANTNKKNKVLKNKNSININNSYMNEYYTHNLKKRKNPQDNNKNINLQKTIKNLDKKNNKKIVKRTSYLAINTRYKINNNDLIGINRTNMNSNNKQIKKEYFINNNNQNVININMVLKQNKNKYKKRNINNYLISTDSMTDTPININSEQDLICSPYFTENHFDNNNSYEKYIYHTSTLSKKNVKKK